MYSALLMTCLLASASQPASAEVHDSKITLADVQRALDYGLTVESPGGLFKVSLGLVLRPRFSTELAAGATPVFSVQMARPQLRISAWQNRIRVFVQPELSGTPKLLDAEVSFRPFTWLGVRAGRFVTPFSRSFVTPVPHLKFADFSVSDTFFRFDRDVGGSLLGAIGRFDYEIGVFNGTATLNSPLDRAKVLVAARVNLQILNQAMTLDENRCYDGTCPLALAIGANAYYQVFEARDNATDPTTGETVVNALGDEQRAVAGLDLGFGYRAFQLQAELFYRARFAPTGGRIDALGGYVQASYSFTHWLELTERFDALDASLAASADRLFAWDTLLTSYIFGDHAKLWLQYSYRLREARAPTLTGWASVANAHQLMLSGQVWF